MCACMRAGGVCMHASTCIPASAHASTRAHTRARLRCLWHGVRGALQLLLQLLNKTALQMTMTGLRTLSWNAKARLSSTLHNERAQVCRPVPAANQIRAAVWCRNQIKWSRGQRTPTCSVGHAAAGGAHLRPLQPKLQRSPQTATKFFFFTGGVLRRGSLVF